MSGRRRADLLFSRKPLLFELALLLLVLFLAHRVGSAPLSTRGRWVVDAASGQRVKLRCVNWAAHMPAVMPEGLDKQPLRGIATRVAALGFNCVRLTWATHLFTGPRYENLTVGASLRSLGLHEAAAGVEANNPSLSDATVREAYDEVVRAVGEAGLMAVLDNHVSRPQWCCSGDDGNGFFGDLYFDPDEWLQGLDSVARRFRGIPQVVGMSMRNELRGPNQSEAAWYRYVMRGARAIHEANPDVLVVVSGLSYDTDLSFLAARPLRARFDDKLVLEAHWYAFSEGRRHDWAVLSPNGVCAGAAGRFDARAGFISRGGVRRSLPLFVSEFGIDQRGTNSADNRFLSCFLAFAAERDLDWAMWALQGSYYWRNGQPGFEEAYGVLDTDWDRSKNPLFQERFRLILQMTQDPVSQIPAYQLIYPPTERAVPLGRRQQQRLVGRLPQPEQVELRRRRSPHSVDGFFSLPEGRRRRPPGDAVFRMRRQPERLDGGLELRVSRCGHGWWGKAALLAEELPGVFYGGDQECLCMEDPVCSENPQTQWFRFVASNVV